MRTRTLFLATTALLTTVSLASAAHAQDGGFDLGAVPPPPAPPPLFVNSIEAGIGYQSVDSFDFGRYGGITGKGPFAIVKGAIDGGDAWKDGTTFWDAAVNLRGFHDFSGRARGGEQGSWRVDAFADGFTRAITDNARTPFLGSGTTALTLPAGWRTGSSSAQFTTLNASLKPLDLKVDWTTVGGAFVWTPYQGYELRLQFTNRSREGLRPRSLPFGQEGNFPVGVFFAEPIAFDTHHGTVSVAHVDPKLQWNVSYNISVFTSSIDSVTVANPYALSLSNAPGNIWPAGALAGYPFGVGQYGSPPDSIAHQVLLAGGYSFSPKTRLTARMSYSLQTQNDRFLPYTANTGLTVNTPLPRASLSGKVEKIQGNVNLTSRPSSKLDLAASYSFDDRRNLAPSDIYSYVANDVQDQVQPFIPGNSRYIRINLPHSFTFHQAKAEAGYRLTPRTRLSVSYTGDFQHRTDQAVSRTNEQSFKAKALSSFEAGSAWISAGYAFRDGTNYNSAVPWDLSHTQAYLNAAPTSRSIEQPFMRKYNLADRRRSEAKGGLTFDAATSLAVSLSGGFGKDDYLHSPVGLTSSQSATLDGDVSYVLGKALTLSAFAGVQRIHANQNGYLIFDTTSGNPLRNWHVATRDAVNSAGARASWLVVPKRFKLEASYSLTDGTSRTRVQSSQSFLGTVSSPLPAARDITHSGEIVGEYDFRPDTAVKVGYTVARHIGRDWQYDHMGAAPVAQILGSAIQPPRYTAHVVWLTTRYQF